MKQVVVLLLLPIFCFAQTFSSQEINKYKTQAQQVTIIRDTWGIPHIYGKTDADAVFGLMYAQCEENFPRVERNYLEIMGRLAEVDGESKLYNDLQMRMLYDSAAAIKDFTKSPAWFQKLLVAFADGVNFYLATHPDTKPLVLKKFQPWFPLMYTDGSIAPTQTGGINLQEFKDFYAKGNHQTSAVTLPDFFNQFNPTGSNGFAIAPAKTASKNAILYINPHVTFYFRSEVQMVSEEGLNAYGAVTWGQFFVYQGFNQHCGWMHTSSYADVADLYAEKMVHKGDSVYYEYNHQLRPVTTKKITIRYKQNDNIVALPVTTYFTHHGPVMSNRNNSWISVKEKNRSLPSLMQSWLRTKANGFEDFKKVMGMLANNSNNTVYADDKGNIAYWHGNFMPKRNVTYDWSQPVDGTTPATEWQGQHGLNEIVHVYNPKSGWIENCNSTPFTASGESSPNPKDYPAYMAPDGQNPRAINAIRLLSKENDFTLDKVIAAGYDRYLSAFDILLPALFKDYEQLGANDSVKQLLQKPIAFLKSWDKYASKESVPTTIAVEWASKLAMNIPWPATPAEASNGIGRLQMMAAIGASKKLQLLADAVHELNTKFGTWQIAWGEVNRYQRNGGFVAEKFDDTKPSLAAGSTSSMWGCLPAFEGRQFPGVIKRYGVSGNSFVAAVEFGKKVKAKTVVTGGQSFDPSSPHFNDQAQLYLDGKLKDIFFYKEDVLKNMERKYHPGE